MSEKEMLGHPKGLFVLFFTEMWERFSYYGMRALLVLYMTQYLFVEPQRAEQVLGFTGLKSVLESMFGTMTTQALSSQLYGLYTGLVYLTPFFGGLIADRVIGQRRSVYVGGILMAIGHFLMAFEQMFFLALLFLILGNGFFKPNISTQVGALYAAGDGRRDRAFTIFYMGINLGAFFSPIVCGTLGQKVGWHYGFTAAGVGMLIGLVVYYFGQKRLPKDHIQQKTENPQQESTPLTKEEKNKVWALIVLCTINVLFWGVFEQQGNTLQIWADKNTNWNLLGLEIPSTWYQAFNPFIIFTMAPFMDRFWAWQNRRGKEPGSVSKMMIGCLLASIGFLIMGFAVSVVGTENKGSLMWLFLATYAFTLGELYLSPIGLSLVTKLAPARMVSMLMGVWLMSSFVGNYLAGFIGAYYETLGPQTFFYMVAGMAGVAAFLFLVTGRPLRRATQGV